MTHAAHTASERPSPRFTRMSKETDRLTKLFEQLRNPARLQIDL